MQDTAEEYLTVSEVAEVLKVSGSAVRNWLASGRLGGIRLSPGRLGWRTTRQALDSFIRLLQAEQAKRQPPLSHAEIRAALKARALVAAQASAQAAAKRQQFDLSDPASYGIEQTGRGSDGRFVAGARRRGR